MTRRREFIIQISAGSAALLAGRVAMAADMVAETDPQAGAMNMDVYVKCMRSKGYVQLTN